MFTVKRETSNYMKGHTINTEKHECEELSDAIELLEKLRKADLARYRVLISKHPGLYYDDSHDDISYHFIVGTCEISCSIEGIYEDAYQTFFIACQLKEK